MYTPLTKLLARFLISHVNNTKILSVNLTNERKQLLPISYILNLPPTKKYECNLRDVREIHVILQQYRAVTTI